MSKEKKESSLKESFLFRFFECFILQAVKGVIGFVVYYVGAYISGNRYASEIVANGEFDLKFSISLLLNTITKGKVNWLHESVTASAEYGVYCWIMLGLSIFLVLMCLWALASLIKGLTCITLNICTECPNYLICKKAWKVERKY